MTSLAQKIYMIFIKNIFSKQNITVPITTDNIEKLITTTGGILENDPSVKKTTIETNHDFKYCIKYSANPMPIYDICFFWCQAMLSLDENGAIQTPLKNNTHIINLCKELTVHMLLPKWYFEELIKRNINEDKINLTNLWKKTGIDISVLKLRGDQLQYWTI